MGPQGATRPMTLRSAWHAGSTHGPAFGRSRARSTVELATADRLAAGAGAVATLTRIPDRPEAVAAATLGTLALACIPAVVASGAGSDRASIAAVALRAIATLVVVTPLVVTTERRVRLARRWGPGEAGSLVVADVASARPGRGEASRLLRSLTSMADQEGARLVLQVATADARARRLYARAGFVEVPTPSSPWRTTMARPAHGTRGPTPGVRDAPGARRAAVLVIGAGTVAAGAAVAFAASAAGPSAMVLVGSSLAFLAHGATVDRATLRIPNSAVAGALVAAVAARSEIGSAWVCLAGALVASAPSLVVHLAQPRAMGFGDVKFSIAAGALVGVVWWPAAVVVPLISLVLCVARRRDRNGPLPFGPLIHVATLVALAVASAAVSTSAVAIEVAAR
ncbi:prepilin peptidase [Ilumatobacter sp.]|uniref:prepilin peptidase n=1 Tax=Ilumatobacter sp. TaxID=1967498 RepID=UPI003B52EF24